MYVPFGFPSAAEGRRPAAGWWASGCAARRAATVEPAEASPICRAPDAARQIIVTTRVQSASESRPRGWEPINWGGSYVYERRGEERRGAGDSSHH